MLNFPGGWRGNGTPVLFDYSGYDDGEQDNLENLKAVLNESANEGGGVIRFLPARVAYLFSGRIMVPSNMTLIGYGRASRLRISPEAKDPLFD